MNLQYALADLNVRAFLRVIRAGESSQTDDAYRMLFGGALVDNLSKHPNRAVTASGLTSTAAGAYQFLSRTWVECAAALKLTDFSPASQDLAAVFLIQRRKALQDVIDGDIEGAIAKCNKEWASLPGSPYGQPVMTMEKAMRVYAEWREKLAVQPIDTLPQPVEIPAADEQVSAPAAQPEKPKMALPAILMALLPSLIESIPKLGKLFGSGSAVAERNVKAAELAFTVAQTAVGAVNAQEVVERLKADPEARAVAAKAIEVAWLELSEAGGDGISGARKADEAARASADFLRSPSFWMGLALLPLVYLLVLSLIGLIGSATWSDDVRAGLAGSLISAVIGGLIGFYYGQSTTRNRTPAA